MPSKYEFIEESSNYHRIKVFVFTLFITLIVASILISVSTVYKDAIGSSAPFLVLRYFILEDIKNSTPIGLLYIGFFTAIFFNPLPTEVFFVLGLIKGNPILLSSFFILLGFFASQAVNYFLGAKFSNFFLQFISKTKVYQAKRKVNKYGGLMIMIFNLLPLPAPLLSFALGIAKYNRTRFAVYFFISNIIKYLIVIGLFLFFRDALLYILKYL